ncbi:hypothetical protein DM02DRAFT_564628 [Periconia macrospinosa]|uniref:Uncharacterized protein n=1 Tax=Periconia macrospinosa TaxID=97972 RepID=A0A2V1DMN6_9PLEO|nr:hypothetical protein DM02DRAFT_564628 [Periconia macrospinosa]
MPHKHKRKAEDKDESNFNLPPTEYAAPLAVRKGSNTKPATKKRKVATIEGYGADDTPRAFMRLMAFSKTGKRPSGLDDGPKKGKKNNNNGANKAQSGNASQNKTAAAATVEKETTIDSEAQPAQPKLKIMPGESLSEFRQRVNQALPLGTVAKTGKKIAGLSDHRVTKHERRLKRLQEGWRKEEARIRDKEQEERELAEEEEDEAEDLWEDRTVDLPAAGGNGRKGKKKKGKRKLVVGEVDDGKDDEWEVLRKKREERKGLHDVVQAPPTFDRVPREIFKVKDGAKVNVGNVPNSVGSLRKREELGVERQGIIETYRKLMAAKREG